MTAKYMTFSETLSKRYSCDLSLTEMSLKNYTHSQDLDILHICTLIKAIARRYLDSFMPKCLSCGQRKPWSLCEEALTDSGVRYGRMSYVSRLQKTAFM